MTHRVAILQSNYIPWKGYLDIVGLVDEFVLLDEVQYTRRDWRNRNRIKTPQGVIWLTIPVDVKGRFTQRIDETRIADASWAPRHWQTIEAAYRRAPQFDRYRDDLAALYGELADEPLLSRVNRRLLEHVAALLGITTTLRWSSEYDAGTGRSERILDLCSAAGATTYLSGPAAQSYLDVAAFGAAGIEVEWMRYAGYPEYPQLHGPFAHDVSVLDLLFMLGPEARRAMRCGLEAAA